MEQNTQLTQFIHHTPLSLPTFANLRPRIGSEKSKADLAVLRYMLRCLRLTLLDELADDTAQWMLYYVQERRKRTHRIAIYQPQALLTAADLHFVGFISRRREQLNPDVLHDIQAVDQQMLSELRHNTSLLSYSSLELRNGQWYNLVLLSDEGGKAHFRASPLHRYAAYDLSPRYYEWIRLHSGRLPGALSQERFVLQKTRYYFFSSDAQLRIEEVRYA
jgi:hypothetical protein